MALTIDSSSPAAHTASGSTPANTCAAFIPPDSALLLAMWAGDSHATDSFATPGIASSPSQSWTTDGWDWEFSGSPTEPGQAAIMHAALGASPGSMTVTVTNNEGFVSDQGSVLKVYVILGQSVAQPIGVTGGNRQASGTSLSDSYTGSITGGQGFMVVCDWAAADSTGWTAATGCTIENKGTVTGEISYAVIRRTDPDGVLGASTTLGLTGLTAGGQYHWVYAEVISQEAALAAEGQCGYPARGTLGPPMF